MSFNPEESLMPTEGYRRGIEQMYNETTRSDKPLHIHLDIEDEIVERKDFVVIPLGDPDHVEYTGYSPATPADFFPPVDELKYVDPGFAEININPNNRVHTWCSSKNCTLLVLVAAVVLFIFTTVISAFSLECKIGLCDKLDRSTEPAMKYNFKNFPFPAPFKYVWAAMGVAIFGVGLISVFFFIVLQKDTGTVSLANFVILIRLGAREFINRSQKYLLLVFLPIIVLTGLVNTWTSTVSLIFGVALSILAGSTLASVGTRGAKSATSAAQTSSDSIKAFLETALRSGSVVGVAVVSCSMFGLSISYLLFQDVRALGGFMAGVSCLAIVSRVGGGMFKRASDIGPDSMQQLRNGISEDNFRNPASVANAVGDILGNVVGMSVDYMATHAIAIGATAILGASMPYFYKNPYAMCVFNHLWIDQTCVVYDRPTLKGSIAASVCRRENFYEQYNNLEIWQSNSLFVALPFLLGLVGILSSAFCSLRFFVPSAKATQFPPQESRSRDNYLRLALPRLRINLVLSAILTLGCTAGICWGLFGSRSAFQTANAGMFEKYDLQPLTTDNAATRCRPLDFEEGSDRTELPDLQVLRGPYKPLNSLGVEYPSLSEVPIRLFMCVLIGSVLGLALSVATEFVTNLIRSPVRRVVATGERGAGALIVEGLGTSLMFTMVPLTTGATVIGLSFRLFGAYGVGLSAVGLVSSLGSTITLDSLRPMADNAKIECQSLPTHAVSKKTADLGSTVATTVSAGARGVSSLSTVLSSFALLAVIIQESGLVPSPRQLVGSVTARPSRHITDVDAVNIIDVYVLISTLLGVLLPCLFAALLLLSGSQEAQVMTSKIAQLLTSYTSADSRSANESVPSLRSGYARCVIMSSTSAIFETFLPALLVIATPLVIGFGFGQRALIGMLLGTFCASFVLSVTLNNTAAIFESVKRRIDDDLSCKLSPKSSVLNAVISADSVGRGLTDCCGPSLNSLSKSVCSVGLVTIRVMKPDIEKGWVGLIILIVALILASLFSFVSSKRRGSIDAGNLSIGGIEGQESDNNLQQALKFNPSVISPFYEDSHCVQKGQISPVSPMRDLVKKDVAEVRFRGFEDDEESDDGWSPVYLNRALSQELADGEQDDLTIVRL